MIELVLIGIGTGNPEHLTLQAIREINTADLILLPRKGEAKSDLVTLRRSICADLLTNPATQLIEFDMPVRDATNPDYRNAVDQWHDAIAQCWITIIQKHLPAGGVIALLVWGDPALYDSTLRIASRLKPAAAIRSIPGIMSLNMLTAAHGIALNEIAEPFLVTTGRQLRDHGWPAGTDTIVVMLDGECSFQTLDPSGISIHWGAYLGMAEQLLFAGPLAQIGDSIVAARASARAAHGWIMDIYLLKRQKLSSNMRDIAPEPELPVHGGQVRAIMREFPNAPQPFIDLSTGINPKSYPFQFPSTDSLTRLPESDEEADLLAAAAEAYGASGPELVASGAGSQSLISLLPRLLHASRVHILGPTYSGHAAAWQQAGAEIVEYHDFEMFQLGAAKPGSVNVVCSPNNPDGRILPASLLRNLADRCAEHGSFLVVDEAFADFDTESVASALPHPALIVLRSFGKTYGLPGLRLGFLLADSGLVSRTRALIGSWPVSNIAIAAGRTGLRDREWRIQAQLRAAHARARLAALLDAAGLEHEGEASLFVLLRLADAPKLWRYLCENGIVARIFENIPDRMRLGLPADESAWARLAAALNSWKNRPCA